MAEVQLKRELKHRRSIRADGFLREDGLWDIEATMTDIKAYDVYRDFDGSLVPTGAPFHDISVALTLDDSFVIQDICVTMDAFPFPNCGQAAPNFAVLKGTRIGPGWHRLVKSHFKEAVGCTHVLELMPVVATTAFQTMWQPLAEKYPQLVAGSLAALVGSCQGWSADGPMVEKLTSTGVLTTAHFIKEKA